MRHPLTGGGMTVALTDAQLLCDMLRPLPDFSDTLLTSRTTGAFYTRRKPLSATINTLAGALYRVRRTVHEARTGADRMKFAVYQSSSVHTFNSLHSVVLCTCAAYLLT